MSMVVWESLEKECLMTDSVALKTKRTGDMVEATEDHLYEGLGQILEQALWIAKDLAPSRSGKLSGNTGGEGGIRWYIEKQGFKLIGIMTATALNPQTGVDYAGFIHDGTGVFGEKKQPIKPKHAKYLVFLRDGRPNPTTPDGWKKEAAAGNVIYAKEVQGIEGTPFLADGLLQAWKDADQVWSHQFQLLNNEVK